MRECGNPSMTIGTARGRRNRRSQGLSLLWLFASSVVRYIPLLGCIWLLRPSSVSGSCQCLRIRRRIGPRLYRIYDNLSSKDAYVTSMYNWAWHSDLVIAPVFYPPESFLIDLSPVIAFSFVGPKHGSRQLAFACVSLSAQAAKSSS